MLVEDISQKETLTVLNEEKLSPNVVAVSSLCENGQHIIMWDFDLKKEPSNLYKIETSLKAIAEVFKISHIYIFETRNGYNAISLNKLEQKHVFNIKSRTTLDDRKHLEHGLASNSWKIRLGDDKNLVGGINTKYNEYMSSNAHRICLNSVFDCDIKKSTEFDNSEKVLLEAYWCWKETYHGK